MIYHVDNRQNEHYIVGLRIGQSPDCILYHKDNGVPSFQISNANEMQSALEDLFQIHATLTDGDVFETEFGRFQRINNRAFSI